MDELQFDLDMEMIEQISEEFDPEDFVNDLDTSEIEAIGSSFEKYGRELARRSIELGEKRTDRTEEVLKSAMEKTNELKFPLVPERYLEIAYLSIQPFKRLWVHANSPQVFSYKIEDCSVYQALADVHGEDLARKLPCKDACLSLAKEIFSHFDFDVEPVMESEMPEDDKCEFKIERKEP